MINKKLEKLFNNGNNIALTGQAGTGKSTNINLLIDKYKNKKKFAICATTGRAATLIGGQTLHSFLNLGMIRTDDIQKELSRIIYNPYADWNAVRNTDVLIIDEMSMCDGFLFELVENVLREKRGNNKPFGGVQVILTFDCYQLPPVEAETKGFFFESEAFAFGNFKSVVLKKVHRQNDKQFIDCLNRVRVAKHTDKDIEYLKKREFPNLNYALLDTTCLYPTNKEADLLNNYRLAELEGELFEFKAKDTNFTSMQKDFSKCLRCPETLKLKSGCKVILLTNLNVKKGLCNGSVGTFKRVKGDVLVCEFNGNEELIEKYNFEVYEKSKLVFTREQYPLMLGYAVSIHSSQGMSLNTVAIDFTRVFAPHMAYVSLSRCRNYDGLYLKNLSSDKIFIDNKVTKFMESLK